MNEENEVRKNRFMELCRNKPCYIITICLLVSHLFVEILFLAFRCWPIACINLVSIGIYVLMTACYDRLPRNIHVKVILWEVLIFSLSAVALYGDDACYSVNVIPLIPVMCCWDYDSKYVHKDSSGRIQVQVATVCIVVVYIVEQLMDAFHLYVGFPIPDHHTTVICFFNFITLLAGVLISTLMWWNLTDYTAGLLADSLKKSDYLANHDPLTGLRNRKSLDEHISEMEKKNQEYAFIIADIDDFKKFNDTYGHDCGDAVLQKISRTIRRYVRANDHIYRWGGEEIVIIMTDIHKKLAEQRAADICRAISEEEFLYEGNKVSITVTMGIAVSHGRIAREVMREADRFLFQGKEFGKNCAVGTDGILKNR